MCGIAYTPETKYEICKRLSDIGVHIMDVGFPAVSEDERRSLQLIMQGKRKGEIREDLDVVVMCRSTTQGHRRDAERARRDRRRAERR